MGQSIRSDNPSASTDKATAVAERVLRAEAQAVLNVVDQLDEQFEQAVSLLRQTRGNVICSGMGKSGLIAQKLSATLASTGTPSHFLHPAEAMHGDLGRIRQDDLLLMLSYSGEGEEVVALGALVQQDGVPVIAITSHADSHLGRIARICLPVGDVTEACPYNLAPTASTTAMLALGDALALAVADARSFSADDFAKRHPGGLLGRRMMKITDVLRLRAGENLPLIDPAWSVQRVIEHTSTGGRRPGAVLMVDDDGRLAGIFTDADMVKLLVRQGPEALNQPIGQVMTPDPRRLDDSARVSDAVQMAREYRIDEIPVVDAQGRPVGLVDVQDLVALRVIEPR